jgi:molybdate transport system substrate-binding protein
MWFFRIPVSMLVLIVLIFSAPNAWAANVLVFAAASTANVLDDINQHYVAAGKGRVLISFGSSGRMARQIENGAPADIFITADETWLTHLGQLGLVGKRHSSELARNQLVLIAPKRSRLKLRIKYGFALAEQLQDAPLAIADPGHAPAGRYAEAALTTLGVWRAVTKRAARTNNVREALALVERGEAAAGIVYVTDAKVSRRVRIIGAFPEASHPPISYHAAIITGRMNPDVQQFFEFLRSKAAKTVLRRHGFRVK